VLETAGHESGSATGADVAADVLLDSDLWVLGAPLARFDEYCRQVREEYADVPAAAYASARSKVLRPFLVRPHVYRTAHARGSWEPAARENLARELTRLRA
jgi:predicted metal-dependent HD superfamily phosphohydrolase